MKLVKLSDQEVEEALFAVNDAITLRKKLGWPVPEFMVSLAKLFDTASLTCGMSARGHDGDAGDRETNYSSSQLDSESLGSDLVGSREAADMLGLSTRQVRRHAPLLGAEIVGGRMVFSRAAVIDYAEEQRNGRTR